jgi:hypothetical protein
MQSFLEYVSHKDFDSNLKILKNLLENTGPEGINFVQNEINLLNLNEGWFNRNKETNNVKMKVPTRNSGGVLGVNSDLPDYRNQADVAINAISKLKQVYGPHHTINIGSVTTTLEKWFQNIIQNLSRIRNSLPGPEANASKATQFANYQAMNPTMPHEEPPIKKYRSSPENTKFFRQMGATNKSNQWNPDFS